MGRSAQSIDAVTDKFGLTNGDARLLLAASRGEGLLVAGRTRISFRSVGSAAEHELAVTGLEVTEMLAGYGRTRAPVRVPVLSSTRVALTARGDNR
jgi:hypothetical protein